MIAAFLAGRGAVGISDGDICPIFAIGRWPEASIALVRAIADPGDVHRGAAAAYGGRRILVFGVVAGFQGITGCLCRSGSRNCEQENG
jgi:hypothetical protein